MISAFPQWKEHWDALKLASDFTVAMHMGLLLHLPVFGNGERTDRVRKLATQVVNNLYEGR